MALPRRSGTRSPGRPTTSPKETVQRAAVIKASPTRICRRLHASTVARKAITQTNARNCKARVKARARARARAAARARATMKARPTPRNDGARGFSGMLVKVNHAAQIEKPTGWRQRPVQHRKKVKHEH